MDSIFPSVNFILCDGFIAQQSLIQLQQASVFEMTAKRHYYGRLGHLITQSKEGFPTVPYSSQCYRFVPCLN